MPKCDAYALGARKRQQAYEAAYNSPEARAWIASMTPDQRKRAEELGLLQPMPDAAPADTRLDTLPQRLLPIVEHAPELEAAHLVDALSDTHRRILASYFSRPCPHPKLRQHCLCFLLGIGSGVEHAKALGMSRQRFDYHALKMRDELELPSLGFTRRSKGKAANFDKKSRKDD